MARTTDQHLSVALEDARNALQRAGVPIEHLTLQRGNVQYKIDNHLTLNGTSVWANGDGGTSATDAWKALRLVAATANLIADTQIKARS